MRQTVHRSNARRRGFSLIEATISLLLVGTMLVAVLHTVGASQMGQRLNAERERAMLLAEDLMAEIVQQPYEDPDGTILFGKEANEPPANNRAAFDDVDDYHNWSSTPPEYKDGTPIAWATRYERTAIVEWVAANDLGQTSVTETGAKRIRVLVYYGERKLAELEAVRTIARPDPLAEAGN